MVKELAALIRNCVTLQMLTDYW